MIILLYYIYIYIYKYNMSIKKKTNLDNSEIFIECMLQ